LEDTQNNSMLHSAFLCCTATCHFRATDFLKVDGKEMKLVIRDQKTTRTTGNYVCPVPELIKGLLKIWLDEVRDTAKESLEHTNVLWKLSTGKPFDQQGFSKFCSEAFKTIVGDLVNLQTIRRMFVEGAQLSTNPMAPLTVTRPIRLFEQAPQQ
jgi:hypothetical protein